MKPKNIPWIILGSLVIFVTFYFDQFLGLPSAGVNNETHKFIIVWGVLPVTFFLTAFICNYKKPLDWFQLIALAAVLILSNTSRTSSLVVANSWLIFFDYILVDVIGIYLGLNYAISKLGPRYKKK